LGVGIIGTTRRGIGPCYSTKALRCGLRVGDLLHWNTFEQKFRRLVAMLARGIPEEVYGGEKYIQEELVKYNEYSKLLIKENLIIDSVEYIHSALSSNKKVLIEGANATMLDIDFGTYPFVTSSNPSMGGASTGLGVPPSLVGESHGVMKAYTTRVGAGPFPTEDFSSAGELMVRPFCLKKTREKLDMSLELRLEDLEGVDGLTPLSWIIQTKSTDLLL
jgi:adenylosuccinate synthase